MSEINHPYSGNERNVLLTWFRGIRVSDTQCPRSASAPYLTHHFQSINFCSFYPLLLYHPSLRLGLCHLHRPGLQSWPHLNPSQRRMVSWSNSFKDSPRPAVENPAPKPSPPRFPLYLNVANFSAPESNLGSLRNADLRASAKEKLIQPQVEDQEIFSSPPGSALGVDGARLGSAALQSHCLQELSPCTFTPLWPPRMFLWSGASLPPSACCLTSTAQAQPHSRKPHAHLVFLFL